MMAGTRQVFAALLLALLVIGTALTASAPAATNHGDGGEIHRAAEPIAGQYVVTLQGVAPSHVPATAAGLARANGGTVLMTFQYALQGFSASMSEAQALALSRNPQVASVWEDGVIHADLTQSPATWGLDRVDQRDLPLNNAYNYDVTASNVHAYIIDTGIRTTHTDFGGRASVGVDEIGDGQNGQDCNGHGTHVAGTVGGSTYGIAKAVSLVAVRVLNCQGSGTYSPVIHGVDWVTSTAITPAR